MDHGVSDTLTPSMRFSSFLKYRGVMRVATESRQGRSGLNETESEERSVRSDSSDRSDTSQNSEESPAPLPTSTNIAFLTDSPGIDLGVEGYSPGSSSESAGSDSSGLAIVQDLHEDNLDADVFYTGRRELFGSGIEDFGDDEEFAETQSTEFFSENTDLVDSTEYVAVDNLGERRYSTNTKERYNLLIENDLKTNELVNDIKIARFPSHSQDAYTHWERHDTTTMNEIDLGNLSDDYSPTLGIYDPFNPDLTTIENSDPSKIVRREPGTKFRDSLQLNHVGIMKLFGLESIRKYKNNLSTIISSSQGEDYLVIATNSELVIFDFESITHLPNKSSVLKFDTKPNFTSTTDRLISTWPYFPHTINYLKTASFMGKQVLAACLDDSTLMIWYSDTILEYVHKFDNTKRFQHRNTDDLYQDSNRFYGLKIHADFVIRLESSLWGVDFISYHDKYETFHNLIVASDNSQGISLFYYHSGDHRFYHIKSHQVLHNIPEVSFLNHKITDDDTHIITVSCASISGELLIFKFKFRINIGPLDKDEFDYFKKQTVYYVDPSMEELENRNNHSYMQLHDEMNQKRFPRLFFWAPTVITRALFSDDCWTSKPINSKYFLPVQSISAVFGDPFIEERKEIKHIINESTVLDMQFDPLRTSHLGLAANWQFYEAPITSLAQASYHHETVFEAAQLTGVDDSNRRIHKGYLRKLKELTSRPRIPSANGKSYWLDENIDQDPTDFLAVSTSKKLGLFRADTLFCNSATKKLFDLSIPFNEESKYSDRISITLLIPPLLCFIALSQQGLVTIMRLCQHRGVYGMRQEHLFPNALSLALGYHGYRTISGLAVRDRSLSPQESRFLLYITYTDGLIISYQLSLNHHDILVVTRI